MNELIQIGPISPLRQRLIDDMAFRRFTEETQRGYLRDVGRFATWLGRSPHTASAEDIRQFQIEQQQAGVPAPTMNSIVAALRFFFTHTLDRPDLARRLVRTKHSRKIPVVLTMAEVKRLLDATRSLKHQAALSVAYGAGLQQTGRRRQLEVMIRNQRSIADRRPRFGKRLSAKTRHRLRRPFTHKNLCEFLSLGPCSPAKSAHHLRISIT